MLQLLVFMNLIGSMFIVLHMLFTPLEKKYIPPQYRVYIHRMNLMCFFIPFPICLFYMRRYFDTIISQFPAIPFPFSGAHIIVHLEKSTSFVLPKLNYFEILFLLLWVAIMIYRYRQFKSENRKLCNLNNSDFLFQKDEVTQNSISTTTLVDIVQKELKLKKKPRILLQKGVIIPHVSGIIRPTLCLPFNRNVSEQVYYMIIKHELSHIRHNDLLFQRIALIAEIINWFNPFLFLMCKNMADCEELAADACACKGASKADCNAYQTAILDLASNQPNSPYSSLKGLGFKFKRKNFIKERILTMKNRDLYKHKSLKLITTALMSIIIFSVSLIPALAYKLPATFESKSKAEPDTPLEMVNIRDLSSKINPSPALISPIPVKNDINLSIEDLDFSESDYLCVNKNGIIYKYTIESQIKSCDHDYSSIQIIHHNKGLNGSCNTIHYNGKRCTKCGQTKLLNEIATVTYKKCPH